MILVDSGPLVALVDRSDPQHARCVTAVREVREPLGTVWPAVAEAAQALSDAPGGPTAVLEMLRRGAVQLLPLGAEDVTRIQELLVKYRAQPMEVVDAALVRAAEREGLDRVFTLDRRNFSVYRVGGRKFRIIPAAEPPARVRRRVEARRPGRRG